MALAAQGGDLVNFTCSILRTRGAVSPGLSCLRIAWKTSDHRSQKLVPRSIHPCGRKAQGRPTCCVASGQEEEFEADELPSLQVPEAWTVPAEAEKESEWLKKALHQWLDDEYCPEPANAEISRRCASVFYYCLLEKQLDIGDILMEMVSNLETFSFKESFHGAFTSANAAVDLITKRMSAMESSS